MTTTILHSRAADEHSKRFEPLHGDCIAPNQRVPDVDKVRG